MNSEVGCVDRIRRGTIDELRAGEVEPKPVRTRLEVYEGLEMGAAYWPTDGGETVI